MRGRREPARRDPCWDWSKRWASLAGVSLEAGKGIESNGSGEDILLALGVHRDEANDGDEGDGYDVVWRVKAGLKCGRNVSGSDGGEVESGKEGFDGEVGVAIMVCKIGGERCREEVMS